MPDGKMAAFYDPIPPPILGEIANQNAANPLGVMHENRQVESVRISAFADGQPSRSTVAHERPLCGKLLAGRYSGCVPEAAI